jgi:hypothetical protein
LAPRSTSPTRTAVHPEGFQPRALLGALRTPPEFDNRVHRSTTGLHRSYRYPQPTPRRSTRRAYDNPYFIVNNLKNTSDVGRSFGNVNIDYTPLPG